MMTDTNNEHLLLTQDGYVATVTLNRPEKHNVWHPQMSVDLERIMRKLGEEKSVRVIVVTGAGKTFCGGADSDLMAIPKPIICAINGAAIGIGLVLPLFCDFRYAAASAKLSVMFPGAAWLPNMASPGYCRA